jgi:hypothetical protein
VKIKLESAIRNTTEIENEPKGGEIDEKLPEAGGTSDSSIRPSRELAEKYINVPMGAQRSGTAAKRTKRVTARSGIRLIILVIATSPLLGCLSGIVDSRQVRDDG